MASRKKTLAEQHADLMAALQSFTRPAGANVWTSPQYPDMRISSNTLGGDHRARYAVYKEGDRLIDFQWAFTFDGAVATAVSSAS